MKYRVRLETTHEEFFELIRDEIRQICMEHSIPLTAQIKKTSNTHQVRLKAKLRSDQELIRDNIDGSKPMKL